jgi:ribokinase
MAGRIVIAASCIAALSMKGQRFPTVGETVAADVFLSETGGKGTNQALTAARLGSDVAIIGRVGDDLYGESIIKTHKEFGVNVEGVCKDGTSHTGIAFVMINSEGNNMIEIAPGANFKLTHEDFDNNEYLFKGCDIIGFQLEVNIDFVEYGIKKASAMGMKTLLDPAPARHIDESVYGFLDFIKPNEYEAAFLTEIEVVDEDSAFKAAQWFLDKGVKNAVITMGKNGVIILNHEIREHIVPPNVKAQDPSAAGDIFCGAMMHCLAEGMGLVESCRFAVYASARSVQTLGAINAMPTKQEVIDFRNSLNEKQGT